jgi:hypothetical protein
MSYQHLPSIVFSGDFIIKLLAEKLCGTPFPGKPGFNVRPTFENVD